MKCRSSTLPPLNFTQYHALFQEKYIPGTLRDRKKNEYMELEKSGMFVSSSEANFNVLSRYATQFVTTKEERSWLSDRGLNPDLQIFSIHMTSGGKRFNEVTKCVKLKRVRRDGQGKTLSKRVKGSGNFQGSYGRGYS